MKYVLLFGAFFLTACIHDPNRLNRLSLGMTKPQVIDAIGDPDTVQARGNVEFLVYQFAPYSGALVGNPAEYWVILQNGKLVQYGKAGAFDTAAPQTNRVILDAHVH